MWKLWTRDENVQPAAVGSDKFDTDKRALEKACADQAFGPRQSALHRKAERRPVRIGSNQALV
jgi:hypothetical protein